MEQATQKKPNRLGLVVAGVAVAFCCTVITFAVFLRAPTPAATSQPTAPDTTIEIIENTPEPTSLPLGETRDRPYPVTHVLDIGGDMEMTIVSVTRPADSVVIEGNMFNDTPAPNQEYAMIRLHVACNEAANETCNFVNYGLKTVGATGTVSDPAFVAGVPEELQSTEFFGGSTIEGNIVFLVSQGDISTVLFYDPIFGNPVYIALQ